MSKKTPQLIQLPHDECQAFRNCVSNYVKRKKRRLEKKLLSNGNDKLVTHLTNHAVHILETLSIKRHSLSIAIDAFLIVCRECLSLLQSSYHSTTDRNTNNNKDQQPLRGITLLQQILMHIFKQYIHIRDGFVLLTSGECRHTADSNLARKKEKDKQLRQQQQSRQQKRQQKGTNRRNNVESEEGDSDIHHEDEFELELDFRSRLSQLAVRKDGYTKLYSSNCGYSGYGWDEFFNEEVGVRQRLLDALRHLSHCRRIGHSSSYDNYENDNADDKNDGKSIKAKQERNEIWDKLLEMGGAELFEGAFDTHDNIMKELQRKLENYRKMVLAEIQKILSSSSPVVATTSASVARGNITLFMVTEDKFERLELKNARGLGLDTWTIQRQGDTFKGKDKRGALPSNILLKEWLDIMKLPLNLHEIHNRTKLSKDKRVRNMCGENSKKNPQKKRRLVILDSDEEDEDNDHVSVDGSNSRNQRNSTTDDDCLKVTFKEIEQEKNASNASLHDIKKQLGINVDELQRSREGLEAEENMSKKAAFIDETGQGNAFENETTEVLKNATQSPFQILSHGSTNGHVPKSAINRKGNSNLINGAEIILNPSNLKTTMHGQEVTLPRNDILRNAVISSNKEPTTRVVIGGDYRNSRQHNNVALAHRNEKNQSSVDQNNKAFNDFGIHTNNDMIETLPFEEEIPIQFCKWGDEVLEDLGLKADRYPSSAPEKPFAMIQDLGLEQ